MHGCEYLMLRSFVSFYCVRFVSKYGFHWFLIKFIVIQVSCFEVSYNDDIRNYLVDLFNCFAGLVLTRVLHIQKGLVAIVKNDGEEFIIWLDDKLRVIHAQIVVGYSEELFFSFEFFSESAWRALHHIVFIFCLHSKQPSRWISQ